MDKFFGSITDEMELTPAGSVLNTMQDGKVVVQGDLVRPSCTHQCPTLPPRFPCTDSLAPPPSHHASIYTHRVMLHWTMAVCCVWKAGYTWAWYTLQQLLAVADTLCPLLTLSCTGV